MTAPFTASTTYRAYRALVWILLALTATYYVVLGALAYWIIPSAAMVAGYACFLFTTTFFYTAETGTFRKNLSLRDPDQTEAFLLKDDLRAIAAKTGMIVPAIRVFDGERDGIAACAYFSDEKTLVLSRAAIQMLAGDGLEFVLGHELGHVHGKDRLVSLSLGPTSCLQRSIQWMDEKMFLLFIASAPLKAVTVVPSLLTFLLIWAMELAADAFAAQVSDRQVGIRLLESRRTSGRHEARIVKERIASLQRT